MCSDPIEEYFVQVASSETFDVTYEISELGLIMSTSSVQDQSLLVGQETLFTVTVKIQDVTSSEQLIRVIYTGDVEQEVSVNENGGNSTTVDEILVTDDQS